MTRRRKKRSSPPPLMGRGAIEDVWESDNCTHPEPISSMYGRCLSVWCVHCDKALTFMLRFGRNKTMDVSVGGLIDNQRHPVGQASLKGTRDFITARVVQNSLPDGGADPEGECPLRDGKMLDILIEAVTPVDAKTLLGLPRSDFVAAWRGVDCDHKMTNCHVYGCTIHMQCQDCATGLIFDHIQDDWFTVSMTRAPLGPVGYGPHDTREVVDVLREFVGTVYIPGRLADPMSDDPERDATRLADMVATLERHGLLRRTPIPNRPDIKLTRRVSALTCDRHQFLQLRETMITALRENGVKCVAYGRRVSANHILEAMRVAWPCLLEGVGIDVGAYNVDGVSELCVRCGFCTLDDNHLGPEHWERGCPECGYPGFLLDMHVGQAGRA